jgi:hypothetical protein
VEPLRRGAAAFRRGDLTEGITIWNQFMRSVPQYPGIAAIIQAIGAAATLRDVLDREVPDVR